MLFKNITDETQKEITVLSFVHYKSSKRFTVYCESPIGVRLFFDRIPDKDMVFQVEIEGKTLKGLLYREYKDSPTMEGSQRCRYQFKEI